jgi:membrane protease YdiL (CAAX protease family)
MNNRSIFFDESGCLRSGWRVAIFGLGFVFGVVIVGGLAGAALSILPVSPDASALLIANSLAGLIPALLIGWLCGKFLEGLPFRALGAWFTKFWLQNFGVGIFVGAATLTLAVVIAFTFGGLRFAPNHADVTVLISSLAVSLAVFAVGAAAEEAIFRGYLLQTLNRSGLAWLGITLTSLFFGFVHWRNPNANIISTLNTVLAGVWFSIAYLKTRDLWFVWGLHLMWNWMQGAFFGIEVSGLTDLVTASFLKEIDTGPTWLTGENYGVEGGIVTTMALIVSTVVIWYMPFLKPSEEMARLTSDQTRGREPDQTV